MTDTFLPLLKSALAENDYQFAEPVQQKLALYLSLLQKWNKVFNLTAITDPKEMVYLHILDSLSIAPYLHGTRMLDVGSGAGLPGIPLAIMNPEQHWTLLDKCGKKTRFITQAIAELGLKNVAPAHARCEDFHSPSGFDSIVSRAFSSLAAMFEKTEHLLRADGIFIAMKGAHFDTELQDIPPQFRVEAVHSLKIQGLDVERHVVCAQKVAIH